MYTYFIGISSSSSSSPSHSSEKAKQHHHITHKRWRENINAVRMHAWWALMKAFAVFQLFFNFIVGLRKKGRLLSKQRGEHKWTRFETTKKSSDNLIEFHRPLDALFFLLRLLSTTYKRLYEDWGKDYLILIRNSCVCGFSLPSMYTKYT